MTLAPVRADGVSAPTRRARVWRGSFALLVPVVLAILAVMAFGMARVQSDSMEPTLRDGSSLVFDRWSTPQRGDIVVLHDGQGWSGDSNALIVKRVVGVGGDTVVCCELGTGKLLVNGEPQDEEHALGARPGGSIPFRVTVEESSVWVMGDNRDRSADSREGIGAPGNGSVPISEVQGIVRMAW